MEIAEQYLVQLEEHLENYSVTELTVINNLSQHKQTFGNYLLNQTNQLDFYVLLALSLACSNLHFFLILKSKTLNLF